MLTVSNAAEAVALYKSAFGAAEVARTTHGRMPLWRNDRVKLNEVGQAGRRGTHSSAPPSAFR
jgi:uncharacterized glyoxalase superfamily protein PhnB